MTEPGGPPDDRPDPPEGAGPPAPRVDGRAPVPGRVPGPPADPRRRPPGALDADRPRPAAPPSAAPGPHPAAPLPTTVAAVAAPTAAPRPAPIHPGGSPVTEQEWQASVAPADVVTATAPAEAATPAPRAAAPPVATPAPGPSRRVVVAAPPRPPFTDAEPPFRWQVVLPSALGRKVTIRVGETQIDLGGTVVDLAHLRDSRFKLDVEAALFRRAASARMTVAVALADGSTVRVSARNAASSRRATAIVETLTYLWATIEEITGGDQRKQLVAKLERGSEVQVGRLRLTSIGVAWKRHPIVRWSTLGDPRREGLEVVIPVEDGDPLVVPLHDDAYQLPTLIPVLRRRFG
ncbi:hypothetical protein HC251_02985 [Iamia sp. SCSIO 61187]|uniref:hypothetical protein n=1 Tax=Iamia sp. SCSIO 61187 TaxID=2722752 RepID=UPI001C6326AF|nr:hypothetical protein [Iamia sp. SCSIO 61187]QYG91502.1 hypothetical protein HC251_02985 [Iamia sp. SCSIO 61187]